MFYAAMSAYGQDAAQPKLNILIIEGDGAINNIRSRVGREPIVEVTDENHKPVAGAIVSFTAPNSGPGGTFGNSGRLLTVTTDQNGRAVARNFRPNQQAGQYQIRVTATYQGVSASTVIAQSNVIGAAAAAAGAGGGGLFGIGIPATIAVVGAAVAGTVLGIRAATGGGAGKAATVSVGQPSLP